SFEAGLEVQSDSIHRIVSANLFREAVTWQNRAALKTGLDRLLKKRSEGTRKRTKDTRRDEARAASYWQRYCVKNDTIGFFGPVGWARFVSQAEAINVRVGPGLLAHRDVYFEGWCIDALAGAIARDDALRPWVAPRRMPFIRVEKMIVCRPSERPATMTEKEAAIIEACDGLQIAKEMAKRIAADSSLKIRDEDEVYQILDRLDSRGLISWRFEVPWNLRVPSEWHIEANFRSRLECIGDRDIRRRALARLDELQAARSLVSRAAGDAEELDRAMQGLEAAFTTLTGVAVTRRHGKMYSGRTLVYEDCRRDIEVAIGPSLLHELGPPLSLLLASARWFISEVSVTCMKAFRQIYEAIARAAGSPVIEFIDLWLQAQPLVFGNKKRLFDTVLSGLQQRWSAILSVPAGQRCVSYDSEQLRPLVRETFDLSWRGWQYGRYNCPDVMIAASGAEAIRRGEYQLVLGECHVGTNNICNKLFLSQHPFPEDLLSALDRDMPGPRLVPVPDKQIFTSRDHTLMTTSKDFRLEYSRDISGIATEQAIPIGSLVVEDAPEGLVVRTRDGRLRFDLIEAFADLLSERVSNHFKMLPPGDYTPRVSIGRLIVNRETWRFSPAEMPFASEKDEAFRFLEARRWARANHIPRFAFVKSPAEDKPFYIDFQSPILINLLARVVTQSAERKADEEDPANTSIVVTEMLPTPDQAWLPDAGGNLYTSELRIVAVDSPDLSTNFAGRPGATRYRQELSS
ncbi:MAG TPA: lantibiotic dehydratase, partial [Blastocatellia bacterium]|nr:lantibiotic dehydratase [Blastocatellia bacterium]